MAFDQMVGDYKIVGEGTTTDYSVVRTELEGHEIFITTSLAKGSDGSEIMVSTWWDHGSAIVSTVLIDDLSGDMSGGYVSNQGGPLEPIILVGGSTGSGGTTLPIGEFDLQQ